MKEENSTEAKMNSANPKTSDLLLSAIKLAGSKMVEGNLDELRFNVPNTKVSFMLIRVGSEAYRSRELDMAAIIGLKYEISGVSFVLARR